MSRNRSESAQNHSLTLDELLGSDKLGLRQGTELSIILYGACGSSRVTADFSENGAHSLWSSRLKPGTSGSLSAQVNLASQFAGRRATPNLQSET